MEGQNDRNFNYNILKRKCPGLPPILTTTWIPCRDSWFWWSPTTTRTPSSRAQPATSRASSSSVCLARLDPHECIQRVKKCPGRPYLTAIGSKHRAPIVFTERTSRGVLEPSSNLRTALTESCAHDPDANRPIRSSLTPRSFRDVGITIAAIHHVTPLESTFGEPYRNWSALSHENMHRLSLCKHFCALTWRTWCPFCLSSDRERVLRVLSTCRLVPANTTTLKLLTGCWMRLPLGVNRPGKFHPPRRVLLEGWVSPFESVRADD